ncbi:hypothetical protein H4582DRAFT_1984918 [Lactarius indigo]|nr:hypothetical protein H4582DRAFT_1984918 [Lactarius indigo]
MALTQPQPQPVAEPPTQQYTEDGRGANDIIAVTATPEDGWWSGELLDEKRRVQGRHIFPSNFVHLF